MKHKICLVIPVRLDSERFPNKALALFKGKSLLQHSIDIAKRISSVSKIIVAFSGVESDKVKQLCERNNVTFQHIKVNVSCGTEKILYVKKEYPRYHYYVTLPVDEPSIDAKQLDLYFKTKVFKEVTTFYTNFFCVEDLIDSRSCKIVSDKEKVLYTSRSIIPGSKTGAPLNLDLYKKHVGVFVFPKNKIRKKLWRPTFSSKKEGLEQNMFLKQKLVVFKIQHKGFGIDTKDQLKKLEERMRTN